jgi:hypothetical protein
MASRSTILGEWNLISRGLPERPFRRRGDLPPYRLLSRRELSWMSFSAARKTAAIGVYCAQFRSNETMSAGPNPRERSGSMLGALSRPAAGSMAAWDLPI